MNEWEGKGGRGREGKSTNYNTRQVPSPRVGITALACQGGCRRVIYSKQEGTLNLEAVWTLLTRILSEKLTLSLSFVPCSLIACPEVWALRNDPRASDALKEAWPSWASLVTGTEARARLKLWCPHCSRSGSHPKASVPQRLKPALALITGK